MKFIDIYKPIRRTSYPVTSILILGMLFYFLLYKNFSLLHLVTVIGAAVLLFLVWLWLRPGASEISNAENVIKAIGNGRPTFLNIYSNY